ncbi:MAG: hypothetical protein L0Y72_02730 [Gemmataceae bacterium]|nr:hypothetical protein [Gemmataceae bacterium]MCI0737932.1 hypothetical protein [Gemmataceae bacterium]
MAKERRRESKSETPTKDRLGKLHGRFSARTRGIWLFVTAVLLTIFGLVVALHAGGIARAMSENEELRTAYSILGWLFFGIGVSCAVLGVMHTMESLEIRKRGVRHRNWRGTHELFWDEMERIDIEDITTTVDDGGGRRTRYKITFEADYSRIKLGSGFLNAVSALGVIQLLKLHSGVPGGGGSGARRRPKRKRRTGGELDVFEEARDQLEDGMSPADVEVWLIEHDVPQPAAAAMIDKIMAQTTKQAMAEMDSPDDMIIMKQARNQLASGTNPEKVKRYLREHGVGEDMVDAIVASMRRELL